VAFVSDLIFRHTHYSPVYFIGSILVIIGFVVVNADEPLTKFFITLGTRIRQKWTSSSSSSSTLSTHDDDERTTVLPSNNSD
jgi:hypothetical protein